MRFFCRKIKLMFQIVCCFSFVPNFHVYFILFCFFCPPSLSFTCMWKKSVCCLHIEPRKTEPKLIPITFIISLHIVFTNTIQTRYLCCLDISIVYDEGAMKSMCTILMPSMTMTKAKVHHHLSQNANKCQAHINQPMVNDGIKKIH